MNASPRPTEALIEELLARIAEPAHQARRAAPHPRFTTYLENLGWIQLFGYDINRYYAEAAFNLRMQLRQNLFHLDHFDDDTVFAPSVSASTGWYFEYTVVGMAVRHQPDGVPLIQGDHPISKSADVGLLERGDFRTSGEMPAMLRLRDGLERLCGGRLRVELPTWHRGPLDMAVQLRGYPRFVADTVERPAFVHDLMKRLVDERIRWWDGYCEETGTRDRAARISDDWLNVPFVSPAMIRDFVLPRYLELERYHGRITCVHSCGNKVPLQKLLLELKTLPSHEVNHWTDLEATLDNVPPDKHLQIALLNTEVLLADEEKMEADLRRIARLCEGRRFDVVASAIEKVHDEMAEDIASVETWIDVARRVLRPEAAAAAPDSRGGPPDGA